MSCQHATQKQLIYRHMRQHGHITTLIACDKYRCFRLSERIRELESDGHLIDHLPIRIRGKRYMSYSLVEGRKRAA